jgi:uncharacterized protein YndB with AHSA1/START domain
MSDKVTVTAQMLIRRRVKEVFNAFIDPSKTINFWFTKSSGTLKAGEKVTWEWEMYGAMAVVTVHEIINNQLISLAWGEPSTSIDFEFKEIGNQATYVTIKNYGFNLTGPALLAAVMDSTGGFTTVLDGLKAYLEHGINLNLIADKFQKG